MIYIKIMDEYVHFHVYSTSIVSWQISEIGIHFFGDLQDSS